MFIWPEIEWSKHEQAEGSFNESWRAEPTYVAKYGDDLCLGVKGQTNSNSWFSAKSIEVERTVYMVRGRALDGLGWPKALLIPRKLRMRTVIVWKKMCYVFTLPYSDCGFSTFCLKQLKTKSIVLTFCSNN